jgi:Tol biopolymer transport system component
VIRRNVVLKTLTLGLFLGACTVAINQPTLAPVSPPPSIVLPTSENDSAVPRQNLSSGENLPTTQIPITWSGLNLSGKLIYLGGYQPFDNPFTRIQALDLETGVVTTLYQTTQLAWVSSLAVSPDDAQIIMAYSTPTGYPALYNMPLDGSKPPQQLFAPATKDDQYLEPAWSPDGKYLYFVHANNKLPHEEPNQRYPIFEIYRMAVPNGPLEKVVDKAYWPRLSADASRLVYVSENPNDGTNQLFIANADGSNPKQVKMTGPVVPDILDAPVFLPDGQSILFGAPVPAQASSSTWLDRLFGVIVASAHSLPSDWWSVPAAGGVPTQLTHIQAVGLYASISPDNRHVASFSGNGVFIMNPDGTGLTMVVNDVGGISGTVSWIP